MNNDFEHRLKMMVAQPELWRFNSSDREAVSYAVHLIELLSEKLMEHDAGAVYACEDAAQRLVIKESADATHANRA